MNIETLKQIATQINNDERAHGMEVRAWSPKEGFARLYIQVPGGTSKSRIGGHIEYKDGEWSNDFTNNFLIPGATNKTSLVDRLALFNELLNAGF